ncbi:colicin E1 family microcin immunity protein [Pseudomonas sp. 5P_3.1_Bac2]|uniref:colicin E1 family microcin immunity protein n=1 Tax=Pseudomonas sp. 5P_3.1_Bac2 TaxID=2971617 RepID=UPI003965BCFF
MFSHIAPIPPLIVDGLSALLFPFATKCLEDFALRLTRKELWGKGIFADTPGNSGVYALYYCFCYLFAIPLSLIYLLVAWVKSRNI